MTSEGGAAGSQDDADTGGPATPDDGLQLPAVSLANVRVDAVDRGAAATVILQAVAEGRPLTVHLCNAYVLALASSDARYARLLDSGGLNLADGVPVARYARRAGLDVTRRPSGVELLEEVLRNGVGTGARHYFYGSDPVTLASLERNLREQFDGVDIVGVTSPPFGPVTDHQVDELATELRAAEADVVWIGLGTPKQDDVVARLHTRFDGPAIPIGAAFNFIAGTKSRAPRWLRRAGLEWVHRLVTEPRRLWRRYLWGNLRFLWMRARTGRVVRRAGGSDT